MTTRPEQAPCFHEFCEGDAKWYDVPLNPVIGNPERFQLNTVTASISACKSHNGFNDGVSMIISFKIEGARHICEPCGYGYCEPCCEPEGCNCYCHEPNRGDDK